MTHTFINSTSFNVIVILALAACIIGIAVSVGNAINYHRLKNTDTTGTMATAEKMAIGSTIVLGLILVVIIALLVANINRSCPKGKAMHPEVGDASMLATVMRELN